MARRRLWRCGPDPARCLLHKVRPDSCRDVRSARCFHRSVCLQIRHCAPLLSSCLQINSETDFVARNDQFRSLVSSAAAAALGVTALRPGSSAELEEAALGAAQLADGSA